jgi:hypothetical protein
MLPPLYEDAFGKSPKRALHATSDTLIHETEKALLLDYNRQTSLPPMEIDFYSAGFNT